MVHPHWVRGLFGYWEWLNRQIEQSGGYLTSGSVIEPQAIAGDSDDPDEWPIMRIPDHTLVFGNTFLTFDITITNDLEIIDYSFHHAWIGGKLIWRACKNDHRVDETGSLCHVHVNEDEIVFPSNEVDLEDAIRAVQERTVPGLIGA